MQSTNIFRATMNAKSLLLDYPMNFDLQLSIYPNESIRMEGKCDWDISMNQAIFDR